LVNPVSEVINKISIYKEQNNKILEIGSGTGFWLELLVKNKILNHGYGSEINEKYFTTNEIFEIHPLSYYQNRKFDFIMIIDVLHHVKDKRELFKKIFPLLDEEGVLFIKDISNKNILHSIWNTFHDIVFNFDIPRYINYESMKKDLIEKEFCLIEERVKPRFLYFHKIIIFKKLKTNI
jgi:ubiquinone/menaquinone biosynthesis C-methylase UbiE